MSRTRGEVFISQGPPEEFIISVFFGDERNFTSNVAFVVVRFYMFTYRLWLSVQCICLYLCMYTVASLLLAWIAHPSDMKSHEDSRILDLSFVSKIKNLVRVLHTFRCCRRCSCWWFHVPTPCCHSYCVLFTVNWPPSVDVLYLCHSSTQKSKWTLLSR